MTWWTCQLLTLSLHVSDRILQVSSLVYDEGRDSIWMSTWSSFGCWAVQSSYQLFHLWCCHSILSLWGRYSWAGTSWVDFQMWECKGTWCLSLSIGEHQTSHPRLQGNLRRCRLSACILFYHGLNRYWVIGVFYSLSFQGLLYRQYQDWTRSSQLRQGSFQVCSNLILGNTLWA